MRVKLLFPPAFKKNKQFSPPASIPSLTASLRSKGIQVSQDDLLIKVRTYNNGTDNPIPLHIFKDQKRTIAYLENGKDGEYEDALSRIISLTDIEGYGLIGFGALSRFQFHFALLLSRFLKLRSRTPIVIGGAHLASFPAQKLNEIGYIDYLVRGEGEQAIVDLVSVIEGNKRLSSVPGLVYRKGGEILMNPPGNYPIGKILPPDYSDYPVASYASFSQGERSLAYQVSRGCPNACSFCSLPVLPYETKGTRKAAQEIKELHEAYGISHFNIVDRTFNADPVFVREFCHAILDSGMDITWDAYARAEKLDLPLLSLMRKAGCTYLRYGIESGSPRLLKAMNKQIDIMTASRVLKDTSDAGIRNVVYLIAGFPGEDEQDRKATAAFIKDHADAINTLGIHIFRVFGNAATAKASARFGLTGITSDIFGIYSFEYDGAHKDDSIRESYQSIVLSFYRYVINRHNLLYRFLPDRMLSFLIRLKPDTYLRRLASC